MALHREAYNGKIIYSFVATSSFIIFLFIGLLSQPISLKNSKNDNVTEFLINEKDERKWDLKGINYITVQQN